MSAETFRAEPDRAVAAAVAAAPVSAVAQASPSPHPSCASTDSDTNPALEQQIQWEADQSSGASASAVASSSVCTFAACPPIGQQLQLSLSTPSLGQLLYKDALHSVFSFLSLTDLERAMRACRAWLSAARSLPPQNHSFLIRSGDQLRRLSFSFSSPLARHLVKFDVWDAFLPVSTDDFAQILARMPRLRSLSHPICDSTEMHSHLYSSQLRELHVNLSRQGEYEDVLTAQMKNLQSATGVHSLTLTLPDLFLLHSFSLQPLERLLELESLTLRNCAFLSSEQMVHVRRLPSLRRLSLDGWQQWQVEPLVEEREDCPPLQLHHFDGLGYVDITLARAQLLVRMTTLQRLEPFHITPDALQLLAHGLTDLHTLKVEIQPRQVDLPQVDDWPLVRDSLAVCRQLTVLTLKSTPLDELAVLLLALPPSVRKLDIHDCAGFLQSDVFFQCVAEGGLRQQEQLHVELEFYERNAGNPALRVAWLARQRACAPWINAVLNKI
jgi:hypothetical protein